MRPCMGGTFLKELALRPPWGIWTSRNMPFREGEIITALHHATIQNYFLLLSHMGNPGVPFEGLICSTFLRIVVSKWRVNPM